MVSVNKIAHSSALQSGADLWVLPGTHCSKWTKKIDWYLNFQITRSNEKERLTFSPQLNRIILKNQELGLTPLNPLDKSQTPLFVFSKNLLPNVFTLELKYKENPEFWIQSIFKIWKNLNSPSIRIFVPQPISEDQLLKTWGTLETESHKDYGISVVIQ